MTQIIKDLKQAAKNNEIVLIRISVSKSRMLRSLGCITITTINIDLSHWKLLKNLVMEWIKMEI